MSQVTTHVLDTALGHPAAGLPVALEHRVDRTWTPLAVAATGADGRIADLGPDALDAGRYRLTFDTASYFDATGQTSFFPEVVVVFTITDASHLHVPVLLSPHGFSSYRGS